MKSIFFSPSWWWRRRRIILIRRHNKKKTEGECCHFRRWMNGQEKEEEQQQQTWREHDEYRKLHSELFYTNDECGIHEEMIMLLNVLNKHWSKLNPRMRNEERKLVALFNAHCQEGKRWEWLSFFFLSSSSSSSSFRIYIFSKLNFQSRTIAVWPLRKRTRERESNEKKKKKEKAK